MSATDKLAGRGAIERAVQTFGRFRKRWQVLDGIAQTLLVGLGLLLLWGAADALVGVPAWPLVVGFGLVVIAAAWALVWLLVRVALRRVRVEQSALEIEALDGNLDNRLIGSLQLADEVARCEQAGQPIPFSADFVRELVARTAAEVDTRRLKQLVDLRAARKRLVAATLVVLTAVLIVLLAPGVVQRRFAHLHDAYLAVLDSLFPVELRVTPGNLAVVRGRPVELAVEVVGARRPGVRLLVTPDPPASAPSRDSAEASAAPPSPVDTPLLLGADQTARWNLEQAQDSFSYAFEYAGRPSETFRIDVDDLPEVQAINYELVFPAYTSQPPRTLVGRVPRLDALAGTSVLVSFAATTNLHPELCYVEWQDGSRQALTTQGRYGHFSFTIDRPERVAIYLTGHFGRGFEMSEPIRFEVNVQRDQPPTVEAQLKTRKLSLLAEEAAAFGVNWTAEDDFGVDEVQLEYRIDTIDALLGRPVRQGSLAQRIEPARDRAKGTFATLFRDLSPPLEPGDRITIGLAARDNNTETGPSLGKSLPIEIVVVRPDLGAFLEQQVALGGEEAALGGLQRIKRATDLMIDPQRTVRTQDKLPVESQAVKSRVGQESWPSGSEDAVGDYFRLLSGEK